MGISAASLSRNRRTKVIRPPAFSFRELGTNLLYLWQYRDLLGTLSRHRINVRYKQSMLGLAWAILQPLSLMLIYTVIFSVVVKIPSGDTPYPVFAYTALLMWSFFSTALTGASTGLVSNNQLITKVYFPREILPLTYLIAAVFDFLIASCVLILLFIYYQIVPTVLALWVVPIFAIAFIFTTALSFFLSAAQVWFRDVGLAMPLALQLWMFASPVVYPLNQVPNRFRALYILNPMVGIIENFRRVLVQGIPPDLEALTVSAIAAFLLLPLSYAYFKRMDTTMADVI
jgi:lipopolysaccharide transport system permease protein